MTKRSAKSNQIHVIITKDFMETADEFFRYCRENGYNASNVIRDAMASWLEDQKEMHRQLRRSQESRKALKRAGRDYEKSILYER